MSQTDWLCKICGVPWNKDTSLRRKCFTPKRFSQLFAWGSSCGICGYAIEFKGDDCGHCVNVDQNREFFGSMRDQLSPLSEVPFMNNEFQKESITGVQSLNRGEWIAVARAGNEEEETRVKLAKKRSTQSMKRSLRP